MLKLVDDDVTQLPLKATTPYVVARLVDHMPESISLRTRN